MTIKLVKIILAVLFLGCLANMPYAYFQMVRFSALVGFVILAYCANESGNKTEMIIYITLAILFQPLFKISLGRTLWNIVDIIVALALLISLMLPPSKTESGKTS